MASWHYYFQKEVKVYFFLYITFVFLVFLQGREQNAEKSSLELFSSFPIVINSIQREEGTTPCL